MSRRRFAAALRHARLALVLVLAGCAGLAEPLRSNFDAGDPGQRECAAWFRDLDAAVAQAGVGDGGETRIPGFPYLRVDRFLASFRHDAAADPEAFAEWAHRLADLDTAARRAEIANLPHAAADTLLPGGGGPIFARTQRCGEVLGRADAQDPARRALLVERATVPDDYSTAQRIFGLYGLTRIPFFAGVMRWQDDAQRAMAAPRDAPVVMRYVLDAAADAAVGRDRTLPRAAARSRLAVPVYTEEEIERLFAAHAPVFEIESGGGHDRFGMPQWESGGVPGVDVARPVVFRRLAHTRSGRATLVQLVYTIWFPERPAEHAFDLLSGRLDGVIWRVTLAPDGAPLVYDTIHPCGCYHMFFPTARVEPLPSPEPQIEWAFAPLRLPTVEAGARVVVRIASGDHYVVGVGLDGAGPGAPAQRYRMIGEDALRTLPLPAGGTRSLYGPDGLVPGTERAERYFFWPMGIPSAGQMRQWGRHATAFVGRRHFDDARLIEECFRLPP